MTTSRVRNRGPLLARRHVVTSKITTPFTYVNELGSIDHMAASPTSPAPAPRTKGKLAIAPRNPPGRPISTATNLGKLLAYRQMSVSAACAEVQTLYGKNNGVNSRIMCEYLSGRKQVSDKHRAMLATVLNVRPEMV